MAVSCPKFFRVQGKKMARLNWNKQPEPLDQIPPRVYYEWIDQLARMSFVLTTRADSRANQEAGQFHQLDVMCDKWYEFAPWEETPQEKIECFVCGEEFNVDNYYAHFALFHSLIKVPCPFCDEDVFPFELEKHFYEEKHIDIFGYDYVLNQFPDSNTSNLILANKLMRMGNRAHLDAWLPFEIGWKDFPWEGASPPTMFFKCPLCSDPVRVCDIYAHLIEEHSKTQLPCFCCGYDVVAQEFELHLFEHHGAIPQGLKVVR